MERCFCRKLICCIFFYFFGRRTEYNNERRVAKIRSATRRRLEGKGKNKITAATPVHSRPGSAASESCVNGNDVEEENVRFALLNCLAEIREM
jgi:hypothetical protein